jgi:hypothetical protein
MKILNQIKLYDFNENSTSTLVDEKISYRNYEKLPVIGQNSNMKNSSVSFSDSTLNLLEPSETQSQNYSSLYGFNSGSVNIFSQTQTNERIMEPFIFNRNPKFSNKKTNKNNVKPLEKKPKISNEKKSTQNIDTTYIANGIHSTSNEFVNQSTIPAVNSKTKKITNYKQTTPMFHHVDSKPNEAKQFSLSLTNHNYLTSSKDNFEENPNQILYGQIANISENISDKINKILRNYPSIHSRRMEKGKKPLPKLENYLIDNHIRYDIAKEPIHNLQKQAHFHQHRHIHNNEISSTNTNTNANISTSTDLFSKQTKILHQEETSPSHLEASFYDINQSISNAKTAANED